MEKQSTFYTAIDVERRSPASIFRELCHHADYKKLDDVRWREALVNRYGEMMVATPNLRTVAARCINEGLVAKGYAAVDAEHAYFNTFTDGYKNSGDTFYRHDPSHLKEAYTLVDAAIFDIFAHDWWSTWSDLDNDRTNGIYSEGRYGAGWGPSNKLPFSSKVVADILYYDKSVAKSYPQEFAVFWGKYYNLYRDFVADSFMASALIQYRARMLSDEGFSVLRGFYQGICPPGSKVIRLDVYGYYASDIICIYLGSERMLLYIPGAAMPFREFVSMTEMKNWIAGELRLLENRQAFARHFSIYDRQDGSSHYGVDSVLRFIGEGNSQWNPQRFIIYSEQDYDLSQNPFDILCSNIKSRTEVDRDQNPVSFSDYITEFAGFFLEQERMVRMVLPDLPVWFEHDAACTPLGLSPAWVVNSRNITLLHHSVGSRVDSDTFRALDMLRVATMMGNYLKGCSRPADKIPAFASEQQAIAARFGVDADRQRELCPGDEPKSPLPGQPSQIRLVRLANSSRPLVVVSPHAGNQYILLDAITLDKVDNQLVSAVTDDASGKVYYTSNGYLRVNLPFQPYRYAFEYLWTSEAFRSALATLQGVAAPAVTDKICDYLTSIHKAVSLRQCQNAAWELIHTIDGYISAASSEEASVVDVMATLELQVTDMLFPDGMELLKEILLTHLPAAGPQATASVYAAAIEEMAGENKELTGTLLHYALNDDTIPMYGIGAGRGQSASSSFLFAVEDIGDFNTLPTRYFEREPYSTLGLKDNKAVFAAALDGAHTDGLLEGCLLLDNRLYLTCSLEEISHTVSGLTGGAGSGFSVHSSTVMQMLRELSGNTDRPVAGFTEKYALTEYLRTVTDKRMSAMCEIYHLTENFDFSTWDAAYDEAFRQDFEPKPDETAAQTASRQIAQLLAGRGCALPANTSGVEFFLDHLQTFLAAGVTGIGITSLYGDLIQDDIDGYMEDGTVSKRLDAMLQTLDNGRDGTPFRRLLAAARAGNLVFLPVGQSDGSLAGGTDEYTDLYFRGATLLNALRVLPDEGKVVWFTHHYMMFSTMGINAPLPGLTQCLNIPGAWVDLDKRLHCYSDRSERAVIAEHQEWREEDGDLLPVMPTEPDRTDEPEFLVPEDGEVLGLKVFGMQDIAVPTVEGRENILRRTVSDEMWPALKQDVDAIKDALKDVVTQTSETGSKEGHEVGRRLEILGYEPGDGVTLAWWVKGAGDPFYTPYFHMAPTVRIGGNEYVVDVAHLKFVYAQDEGVIILPVENWAMEISARAGALNPYLMYRMKSESELNPSSIFRFMCPRLPK